MNQATDKRSAVVLCAGPLNHGSLPMAAGLSNSMLPVNGRPVIGWILDDLLKKNIHSATIVARVDDIRLHSFVSRCWQGRMDIALVKVEREGTILDSLAAGLTAGDDGPVRIVLGDTLIQDPFHGEDDFAYVGCVEDSRRWCVVDIDGNGVIANYADKVELAGTSFRALAGYYQLQAGSYARECLRESISARERELSALLRRYGRRVPIAARPVARWYDFGHLDQLAEAKRELLQPRSFNRLTTNPVLNTITKTSEDEEKLRDELEWFTKIPDELKMLTPRTVGREAGGHLEVVQEYYGYPTLAELYVYADLHNDTWVSILRHVLRVHGEFRRFRGTLPAEALESMYVGKTRQRLQRLGNEPGWAELLSRSEFVIDGTRMHGLPKLMPLLEVRARSLARNCETCVVHGDFCFSNILFDVSSQIIRLIDPRGSFGVKGIYGDPRYDIAKLRHSVSGYYDHIVAEMFDLREDGSIFETAIWGADACRPLGSRFDQMIVEAGYDLVEVSFIEALLFLSMVPLHAGRPQRQKMMFLTGMKLLNEVL